MCCCCTKNDTELTPSVGVAMLEQNQTIKKSRTSRRDIKQQWQRNPAFDFKPSAPVRNMREQVWDLLRTGKELSVQDMVLTLPFTIKQIEYLINGWVATGYVQKNKGIWKKSIPTFVLIKDIGQEPPRVNRQGEYVPQQLNEAAWRAMRIQKTFNSRQINAVIGRADQLGAIGTYLRLLMIAGYLQPVSVNANEFTTYRLVEDTGCKPPQILRGKKVFDQNLGIIVYDPKPQNQNQEETDRD